VNKNKLDLFTNEIARRTGSAPMAISPQSYNILTRMGLEDLVKEQSDTNKVCELCPNRSPENCGGCNVNSYKCILDEVVEYAKARFDNEQGLGLDPEQMKKVRADGFYEMCQKLHDWQQSMLVENRQVLDVSLAVRIDMLCNMAPLPVKQSRPRVRRIVNGLKAKHIQANNEVKARNINMIRQRISSVFSGCR
jgi:hypothetical protein